MKNRYLVDERGRPLPSAARMIGRTLLAPIGALVVLLVGTLLSRLLDSVALVPISGVASLALLAAWARWMFGRIHRAVDDVRAAEAALLAGDVLAPVARCQCALASVVRVDLRATAHHVLGACASANGDFAEAEELFARAEPRSLFGAALPGRQRARALAAADRAVALVAIGRIADADVAATRAADLASRWKPAPGRSLERDASAVAALARITVLAARGAAREAIDLAARERPRMDVALSPRERALLARAEAVARHGLGGGPLRERALVSARDADGAWAERVLPDPMR